MHVRPQALQLDRSALVIGDLAASGLSQVLGRIPLVGLLIANNDADLRINMY
jgi:hypothetical protein